MSKSVSSFTLVGWLETVVRAQSKRPAIYDQGTCWSYRRLWDAAGAVSRGLLESGLERGDAVTLVGSNSAAYLASYIGVMRAGGMLVPLNPRNGATELIDATGMVAARHRLAADADPGLASELGARDVSPWIAAGAGAYRAEPLEENAPALCVLTSGSTGKPKGVVHSQGSLLHAALQVLAALPIAPDDVSLAFLPFFASAPEHAMPVLLGGGALQLLRRFDVEEVCAACDHATCFDSVPTVVGRLLDRGSHDQLRKLRWMSFASEPMPRAVFERWRDEIGVPAHQFYGLTELLPITHAGPELMDKHQGTVGMAYPSTAISIVGTDLRPLPVGAEGEVVARSPARMVGYLDDPQQTDEAATPEGALRTGDLGRLDEGGRLYLTGRLKDLIISGGLNISPAEIEAAAFRHHAVAAAAAVGVPDETWGETPVLVAVPAKGQTLDGEELLRHCDAELSSYKRPAAVAVIPDMPVIGIGKSAKSVLKAQLLQGELELVRRDGRGNPGDPGRGRDLEPAGGELGELDS